MSLNNAIARIASSRVSASSSLTVVATEGAAATAFSLEFFPGGPAFHLPSETGLLIHTNHFLSAAGAPGDRGPKFGSSSFSRYEQLRRGLHGKRSVDVRAALEVMSSHVGGTHTTCSHPLPNAPFGEKSETLAVVQLDVGAAALSARRGGPCSSAPWIRLKAQTS